MNILSNPLKLAELQIKYLYHTEMQCLMYLKVLGHKMTNPIWKETIADYSLVTDHKVRNLEQLMTMMHIAEGNKNTAGINGIMSEGFEQIEKEENPSIVDTIILKTVILSSHYKLGNYRMLLCYLQPRTYEAYVARSILNQEQKSLLTLMKLIKTSRAVTFDSQTDVSTSLQHVSHIFQPK